MANLVDNNIIRRDFEILDTWDAGIELLGFEVKSLKSGKGSLRGAFVKLIGDRPVLMNAYIPEYQANNTSP
ncbi:MAG: SsrA-binding protein, partial [Candidatus Pacebacteria bacterium]|nr:SsrA-binding protein [Candidatus Paceibacterota bacterium]